MIDYDESGALVIQVGEGFLLSEPVRPYEDDPTLHFLVTAEHRSGGYVQLRWVIRDGAPAEEWRFETSTWREAGEDMRTLAADIRAFIASDAD
ncbi:MULTISPECIES: DUF6228 family protein [Actinomycetes]|uniref:DUF6228 family protein n=1 Tax=Actinomycetes TaxID=1760 RepID=UPI00052676F4|nr:MULTISPECIES: DUF6228 family protein [Actinomycetes]MBM4832717.1 hypothetical protein [Actinospica acidiphila]MCC9690263.1 DUF6228 family protein [Streptomyces sp. MNU103]GGQ41267.1 hypothetical protein GCM10010250_09640 [Streptomyces althioticus]